MSSTLQTLMDRLRKIEADKERLQAEADQAAEAAELQRQVQIHELDAQVPDLIREYHAAAVELPFAIQEFERVLLDEVAPMWQAARFAAQDRQAALRALLDKYGYGDFNEKGQHVRDGYQRGQEVDDWVPLIMRPLWSDSGAFAGTEILHHCPLSQPFTVALADAWETVGEKA